MSGANVETEVGLGMVPRIVERDDVAIGFSTVRKNPISALIRWATGAKVSHVWLLVRLFGVLTVIEASEKGFIPSMSYARFAKKNDVVSIVVLEHDMHVGLAWAAQHFGERYDAAGLFGMLWVLIGSVFHRRWKNPLDDRKALFCSEAIAEILKRSSYPGAEAFVPEETTPEQLMKFFDKPAVDA